LKRIKNQVTHLTILVVRLGHIQLPGSGQHGMTQGQWGRLRPSQRPVALLVQMHLRHLGIRDGHIVLVAAIEGMAMPVSMGMAPFLRCSFTVR